jgi:arsenate reductase
MPRRPRRILFLCTHNSARSQMAEGLLRAHGGAGFAASSAGVVATAVRPEAIAVMAEIGVDIAQQTSKSLDGFQGKAFDEVITVCDEASAACPVFPGKVMRRHWPIDDPARVQGTEAERLAAFRRVRDALRRRITQDLLTAGGA